MLVKKSIVEKWYQTDSWVYKNFSYLFQNPLWSKQFPRGFSVCPYFWLSLFSILFRFCFVAPIQYVMFPVVKVLGKPAKLLDRWSQKVLDKIGIPIQSESVGFSLFVFCLFSGLFSALALCALIWLAFGVVKLIALYAFLEGLRLGIFAFWSILSFVGMWLTLLIHKKVTDTECKTMNYLWVWLVLFFLAAGIFIPTELLHGISVLFTGIGVFLTSVAAVIWHGICVGAGGIWVGIVWLAKVVWNGIWWKPMVALVLPWWGFIAILCAVGWAYDKFLTWMEKRNTETLLHTDPAELYARYRSAWVSLFYRVLTVSDHWKNGDCFDNGYKGRACKAISYYLFLETFEVMWKDKLDKLQTSYPGISGGKWKKLAEYNGSTVRFNSLHQFVNGNFPDGTFEFNVNEFERILDELTKSPRFKGEIESMVKEFAKADQEKTQKKLAKKHSWSHLTCLKVTSAIGSGVSSAGRGIERFWDLVYAFYGQVKTFLAYLWMLAKAKKQGACPYFTFTDPNKKL